jgi:quaternary ammonium compound-resistance protein SugE
MAWFYLIVAGLFEVGFTTSLKMSDNFTNKGWAALFFISITLSFYFLNKAIGTIPI